MNAFTPAKSNAEPIMEQRRLHGGIFILPVLGFFAVILPELFLIYLFQKISASFAQMGIKNGGSSFALYAFLIALGTLPGVVILGVTWVAYLKSEITLTSRRLLFRTGLLSRTSGELPLENVEAIYISEPLLGRLLGYGTVTVTTVGGLTFPLQYMSAPQKLHSSIQKAVSAAKNPRQTLPQALTVTKAEDHSRYMPKG